jgi:hypothetical protein
VLDLEDDYYDLQKADLVYDPEAEGFDRAASGEFAVEWFSRHGVRGEVFKYVIDPFEEFGVFYGGIILKSGP